jgi:glycosyltransferase involved in cell wall biosynthesis
VGKHVPHFARHSSAGGAAPIERASTQRARSRAPEARVRVALSTNILAPYRVPVFRALAATPGWQLRIFTNAESEFDRSWRVDASGLEVERVRSLALRQRFGRGSRAALETTLHLPLGLFAALLRFRPDVIVSSELGPRSSIAAALCALLRIPLVLWAYPSRASAAAAGALRIALRRALVRRADAVIGMGAQARAALLSLGAAPERIFDAPNAHDAESFERALARCDRARLRRALRERVGARERVALVAGRLIPLKGLRELLAAWGELPAERRASWTLLFVGSGPEVQRIDACAAAAEPGEIARLPELPAQDMPALYASCDLLAFPTLGDPWGLVANEAMACGLPVLCSTRAGACDELIDRSDAGNGFAVDPLDPAELQRVLGAALAASDLAERGERARATARRFGPESMAAGMRAAIHMAARGVHARAPLPARAKASC